MDEPEDIQTEIKYVERMLRHIELVQQNCIFVGKHLMEEGKFQLARQLIKNGMAHDGSKLVGSEWEHIKQYSIQNKRINKFKRAALEWSVNQHITTNPHHAEYWESIHEMPEVYVIELTCDWQARATEFGTGLREWIDNEAMKRYNFKSSDPIYTLITKYVDILCGEPLQQITKHD